MKEIRKPDTWENIGRIIITYKADKLKELQEYYPKAELLVYNLNGTEVFQSEPEQPDKGMLKNFKNYDPKEFKMYVESKEVNGYNVLSYLAKKAAGEIPLSTWMVILLFGTAVIALGETMIHYYLKGLAKRLNYILNGMERVRTGDLSVRLEGDENGDELEVIAVHFNEMCKELNEYIRKSYLAEIERQNAEMEALQSQINPHFLYNTLEVIRMKAICNGDKEVAKMLYSMAVMFRSQIKDDDVISLVQELHYCKKYLELFEYRYQSQFVSQVECPEEYMEIPIIKFVLQPILENYFIHGMRTEAKDNYVYIGVRRDGDDMLILVEDNGKGMSESEIEEKNRELRENQGSAKKSIGISNVNRRLKTVYGEKYGVSLEKNENGGLRVYVKFKPDRRGRNEKSDVSRR